jgi:hypothetical protein
MALPCLVYGSERWTLGRTDERRLEETVGRFVRYAAGYTVCVCVCVCGRGARSSVVLWGTTPQARRSRVRFPMTSLDFFDWSDPPSRTVALGSTQPLTEMSTRNLPGVKERPARKADNLTAICEPIVSKMWEPRRLTTLWASTAWYRDSFIFYTV